ncbi:YncE family protein [Epilithonimonas pallida]|uniref:Uncharacterized protein n=1 Tax=Epilithonimonas pallida TaxID=373671 RepID=A0ABY1R2B9_9FLAO|nr:DUF5074 domain-containing protein [Epilithonimonas pallida]SMP91763.1 hypothetical protein SAMN05421679_103267 [Epilithonimonas pallida]
MKINNLLTCFFASALLLVASCNDDDFNFKNQEKSYSGILVSNEGNFGTPSGEVSFIPADFSTIENGIYKKVNNADLGDVVNNIGFSGDQAYIVANNSNKIEVVNRFRFNKTATITDNVKQPRYITFANNSFYVTNSTYNGDQYVAVYNSANNNFVKKINFTDTVERIVSAGNKVFVQHASYGFGNKISVINSANEVEKLITLPHGQITKTVAADNAVYTLTNDYVDTYLYQINAAGEITKETKYAGISNGENLSIGNNKVVFNSKGNVYVTDLSGTSTPVPTFTIAPFTDYSTIYALEVLNGKIFISDAKDYKEASKISVYSLTGNLEKTFSAGIIAGGFYKN